MIFSSLEFLCVFLPVVFALYCVIPSLKAKNALLIVASLFFYAYGEPIYVLLMIFSAIVNYAMARLIDWGQRAKKVFLVVDIVLNLGCEWVVICQDSAAGYYLTDWNFVFYVPGIILCDRRLLGAGGSTEEFLEYLVVYFVLPTVDRRSDRQIPGY